MGGGSCQRPGHTTFGGRGVLPRRWLGLTGGLRRAAIPNGLGSPTSGVGESCPSGGGCSRMARGG